MVSSNAIFNGGMEKVTCYDVRLQEDPVCVWLQNVSTTDQLYYVVDSPELLNTLFYVIDHIQILTSFIICMNIFVLVLKN